MEEDTVPKRGRPTYREQEMRIKKAEKERKRTLLRPKTKEYYRAKIDDGLSPDELTDRYKRQKEDLRKDAMKKGEWFLDDLLFLIEYLDDRQFYKLFFLTQPEDRYTEDHPLSYAEVLIWKLVDRILYPNPTLPKKHTMKERDPETGELRRIVKEWPYDLDGWEVHYNKILTAMNRIIRHRKGIGWEVKTSMNHMNVFNFAYRTPDDDERIRFERRR